MKILLLGEYSNLHATLAKGLRLLGHEVTVASNGDFWKDYPRDIDFSRTNTKWGGIKLLCKIYRTLPLLKGYDIVQLINPIFLELKPKRILPIYKYLRKHNKKTFLLGAGMDYYWVNTCVTQKQLRYSDFNIGYELRDNVESLTERKDWLGTDKEKLNRYIAQDCDGIITMLYEYYTCYKPVFPDKTTFIPAPIEIHSKHDDVSSIKNESMNNGKIKIFIGINKTRNSYKGTDIMLAAAQEVVSKYPEKVELLVAESVPFEQYSEMMKGADIILDQLYSYTPAMNALYAMSEGIIVVGGGEPENYEILNEKELRPIINVQPTKESVIKELTNIINHPEKIVSLKRQSIQYIEKHHDYRKVAQSYVDFWEKTL